MSHPQIRGQRVIVPAIEKHAYCLCLHVKPTCITIGIVKLLRTLLFASMVLNQEFSVIDRELSYNTQLMDERHRSTVAAVTILVLMLIASVSAMLIYGVVKERASYLMPFYSIQLCDFFFALPAFYNREPPSSLADGLYDIKAYWPNSNQPTRYSLMLFSTLIILAKIYFLCVVWKCYRYLRMKEMILPMHLSADIHADHLNHHLHQPVMRVDIIGPPSSVAPPPYDSIVASSKAQPPPYEEAMKGVLIPPVPMSVDNSPPYSVLQTQMNQDSTNLATQTETEPKNAATVQVNLATSTSDSAPEALSGFIPETNTPQQPSVEPNALSSQPSQSNPNT